MSYAPVLTEQQIARIRAMSVTRDVVADEVLYEPNDGDSAGLCRVVRRDHHLCRRFRGCSIRHDLHTGPVLWRVAHDCGPPLHV